jgi:uncharacterized membrane protein
MRAPTSAPRERSPVGPWTLAALSAAAHLVVGYFSVLSGLAVPLFLLAPVWVLWFVLAHRLQRMAADRSWWTPVIPLIAAAALVLAVVGSVGLGFTA